MRWVKGGNTPVVGGTYDQAKALLAEGLTQTAIAKRLGCKRQYIHNVAKGKARKCASG